MLSQKILFVEYVSHAIIGVSKDTAFDKLFGKDS
jgi:hypothetical protein